MNIICLPRGGGKTTELVKRAAADGCPIIITTSYKDYVRDIAEGLGVDMPTVYSFREFANARRGRHIDKVYVDNAEYVLQAMLGTEIAAITVTPYEEGDSGRLNSASKQ